ncbi:putative signal transducing adaptor molecule [Rosellinia necatrix]|uniref:Class E vacuolar protein-sorting machinery protein HSE1 n=1 Tax=Rosellinia necatrix TaxID=77044 RepID=A0A1W2TV15_ROSNE|nr:putative signal transducing adaptor molecule [Rosellinia necatrix]
MFRGAAASPYDEGIVKATDENLTSEDWGAIIDLCDKVSSDPNGPNQAVQGLIKRLAHRNANVQLYTLELGNALSQNCGKAMHRELASRSFTDALLKLANDRNTHQQVKAKILERMKEWSDMFSKDADLGIMYDAYYRLQQSNPTLQPPSAPQKTGLTDLDRQKEEDELQMALKLSLQDEERKKRAPGNTSVAGSSSGAAQSQGAGADAAVETTKLIPSHPTGTTAATVSRVRALYDFVPSEPGELEFRKGDVIAVLESVYKDWWRGSLKGQTGIFPLNYVEKLTDPTPDELHREAQMEAEVFAEIKNVEKLLTLLSTSNTAPREEDNEEISKLYHQTLAIRPKLIKLIEKYSQKKDDFTQLNEKFIKARRDYESLLESSMSQPPAHNYHHYATGPPVPQGYGAPAGPPGPGYAPQGPNPGAQDPPRYYTPGPQGPLPQEHNQYQATSPPPNFQRPTPAPAPFYLQGAEVPSQGGPPLAQQYPPRDQSSRIAAGKQPAPPHPASPPPQQTYQPYTQASHLAAQRPQSTYGNNPQELSTPAYDSPVATHHNTNAADPYSASAYSQDDMYGSPIAPGPSASPDPPGPSQSIATPLTLASHPNQPQYTAYNPRPLQHQDSFDAPSQPPPQPTGSAPPIPHSQPPDVMTPSPLQPGGPHYDSRQSLPSQVQPHGQQSHQPQYKAYVPPAAGGEPSAPQDYYRQSAY